MQKKHSQAAVCGSPESDQLSTGQAKIQRDFNITFFSVLRPFGVNQVLLGKYFCLTTKRMSETDVRFPGALSLWDDFSYILSEPVSLINSLFILLSVSQSLCLKC